MFIILGSSFSHHPICFIQFLFINDSLVVILGFNLIVSLGLITIDLLGFTEFLLFFWITLTKNQNFEIKKRGNLWILGTILFIQRILVTLIIYVVIRILMFWL